MQQLTEFIHGNRKRNKGADIDIIIFGNEPASVRIVEAALKLDDSRIVGVIYIGGSDDLFSYDNEKIVAKNSSHFSSG